MGAKPSHALGANRPESGGTDKDMRQEKSGLLEREKEEFAAAEKAKHESIPEEPGNAPRPVIPPAGKGNRQTGDEGELSD